MDALVDIETERILAGRGNWLGSAQLESLAEHPLECIETEFPHYVRSADSPQGPDRPADRHPIFYGCYDWHSAVHSHWALLRQLRLFDEHPVAGDIVATLDRRLTTENVEREVTYFEEHESFEGPYGWAWFLRLVAELHLWAAERASAWRDTLRPLETRIVSLVESEFLTRDRPIRVGTHGNTAFALGCIIDYARVTGNSSLESTAVDASLAHFRNDTDYPLAYEPLGWDFLSPALVEADLLTRVLDDGAYVDWLERFLPRISDAPSETLPEPVDIESGTDDGMELHLVGLNLSRAWCLAGVADALGSHSSVPALEATARRHAESGLARAFTGEYAGAHWLTSFVLYLATRNRGGIAPS